MEQNNHDELLARLDERTKTLASNVGDVKSQLKDIRTEIKSFKGDYVHKDQLKPFEKIGWIVVSVFVSGIAASVLAFTKGG